jgi:Di-haem oxidoreductase, putative peroxidase
MRSWTAACFLAAPMRINRSLTLFSAMILGACASAAPDDDASSTGVVTSALGNDHDHGRDRDRDRDERGGVVHAQVVATGIPGAGAICQIGSFLRSSPIHDRPAFIPFTAPGAVLNGDRLLVGSTSNYGAPLGNAGQYPGTVLSIDPSAPVAVPAGFAAAGDQASAVGGRVQVYVANNAQFLNSRFEPQAATANEVGASLPLGISLNSGNGRPWFANAPNGAAGNGTITVIDPNGAPLAGAPSATAGGVFAGNATNRPGSTAGITSGAVGTAIISKSSDGSGRAVFASVGADGAIVQVHVQKGVDALVPAGALTPIPTITPATAASNDRHTIARRGIAFNWVPNRVLYVVDPQKDRVLAFDIGDNGTLFTASAPRVLGEPEHHRRHGHHWDHDDCDGDDDDGMFDIPIDVAPTIPEIASENFASNSTLAGGADLYVLNRGNNSIVRVTQDGKKVASRKIQVDGQRGFRANGLGVSPDGKTIWITGQTENGGGVVTKIAGFGSGPIMPGLVAEATSQGSTSPNALGSFFFSKSFTPDQGLGPLFNGQSCATCHSDPIPGGMSSTIFDTFISGSDSDPVARFHSVRELGDRCRLPTGVPHDASSTSKRSSMTLRNSSLIDFVQPFDILANRATQPAAIQGRPNILPDGRIGKFGWKASTPTLIEFMGQAFRNEQGLTNGLVRRDQVDGCGANKIEPELDALPLVTTSDFMKNLDAPAPSAACVASTGATVFQNAGCAGCHTPSFAGPGFRANLYSDLLLHDMGPALADGFVQGSATGSEFRTMTLTRLSERSHFLHDGRALDLSSAITAHGGQGAAAATAFSSLSATDRDALLAFLGCL